ncbi:sigma-70 family RNA polymerase sigma factor [Tsukamurella soli]|uniref:RNA polymerase sigma factor SigJ n=1 Tax=Tsukamurella soli TaxID=644556 RepID=A0ABP8JNH7_9ACTN
MDTDELAAHFDRERLRLRSVAYRIVGSLADADDAVQETWIRLQRADTDEIDNLDGWLHTVTARICLNILRSRRTRAEEPLDLRPEPIVATDPHADPEAEVLLADAVGMALQVVLDSLPPADRVAFVLHDMFGVPFGDIADLLDRTPDATRQLASRARRRVGTGAPTPDPDLAAQRAVVDAYFAAARDGDLDALVAVLDPDVVLRAHGRRETLELRGAQKVARGAMLARAYAPFVRPALVNGAAGAIAFDDGAPFAILAFTVVGGRAVGIDIFNDRELVPRLVR